MLYARLQTVRGMPAPAGAVRRLVEIVSGHPGFAGLCLMEAVEETSAGALLTLWRTEEDARLAADRTEAARGGPRPVTLDTDRVYRVEGQSEGPDVALPPGAAVVLSFDGPHDDAWLESARFAHHERIAPAMRTVPGFVRSFLLLDGGTRSSAVVSLALSLEALARGEKAVNSTELLPGEDPALLTGPDRAVVHRVSAFLGAPA